MPRSCRMQVLTYDKAHTATTQLFPSVARTADLVASKPGIWQYNCDVQDHLVAGESDNAMHFSTDSFLWALHMMDILHPASA
jgi:hypothetical protein